MADQQAQRPVRTGWREIARQALREFWLPFIIAAVWTYFAARSDFNMREVKSWMTAGAYFGAGFFFVSWLSAQYFRIAKQHRVDASLSHVEDRLQHVVRELETTSANVDHVGANLVSVEERVQQVVSDLKEASEDIVGNVTGGSSYFWVDFVQYARDEDEGHLELVHSGHFPMYDVNVEITNAGLPRNDPCKYWSKKMGNTRWSDRFHLDYPLGLADKTSLTFWIRIKARNGDYEQKLKLKKIDGRWESATHLEKTYEGDPIRTLIDSHSHCKNFPRGSDGDFLWWEDVWKPAEEIGKELQEAVPSEGGREIGKPGSCRPAW